FADHDAIALAVECDRPQLALRLVRRPTRREDRVADPERERPLRMIRAHEPALVVPGPIGGIPGCVPGIARRHAARDYQQNRLCSPRCDARRIVCSSGRSWAVPCRMRRWLAP